MNHDGKFFSNFKSSHKDLAKNSKVRYYTALFCLHDSRAIFRTIIDFLAKGESINESAKEMYINHKTDSYVKSLYHRNDYFLDRLRLMCIYSKFIFQCAGMPELVVKVDEYVVNISERVTTRN